MVGQLRPGKLVKTRSTLKAAATKWAQQYINARPLEAQVTPPKDLHDRLIIVDGKSAWSLTQSLKDFAARSPASAMKVDEGIALLKIEAYEKIWGQSDQL